MEINSRSSALDQCFDVLKIKAFETLIESRTIEHKERLHFLETYVTGNAKQVADGFLLLESEDAYHIAKKMLPKRFVDPYVVAAAYR